MGKDKAVTDKPPPPTDRRLPAATARANAAGQTCDEPSPEFPHGPSYLVVCYGKTGPGRIALPGDDLGVQVKDAHCSVHRMADRSR